MTDKREETSFGLKYRIKPNSKFRLSDIPPDCSDPFKGKGGKEKADRLVVKNLEQIG